MPAALSAALHAVLRAPRGDLWPVVWVPPLALLALAADTSAPASLLGWVALAPLAAGLRGRQHGGGGSVAAWTAAGWGWGLVFAGGQLAWLHHALVLQAGMGALHFANFMALLVGTLALFPAAGLGLARLAWLRGGLSPLAVWPVLLAAQDALLGVFPFGGLAWGSLAGPQAHTWAARVVVPVLGGAGLVLLLGLVNAGWGALALAWRGMLRRGHPAGRGRVLALAGAASAWMVLTVVSAWPAPSPAPPPGTPTAPALLVPGDLSLRTLDAQRGTSAPLRYYLGRTLPALEPASTDGPRRLVIWPESAVPGVLERGKALVELSALGGVLGADFLLGANAQVRGREYNALYLVNGGRFDFWRYEKRRLVPFGEYVPAGFRWLFPRKATAGEADYAAGTNPPVLNWRGQRLGLAICFESILPEHVRAAVHAGATVLVAVANDAWLTPTARRRHLRLTALRGLEAGRDVLLVANRGWSVHLRGGRVLARAHWREAPLPVRAALRTGRTPYAGGGLVLPAAAGGLLLLAAGWQAARARRGRRTSTP